MIRDYVKKIKNMPDSMLSGIVYTCSQLLTRGLAIITVPIFTRFMASDQIGVVNLYNSWYSMLSVITTLSLTSGGFQLAMKEFSKDRDQYESSILTITSIMTVLFLLIYLINPYFWQNFLGLSNKLIVLMIVGFLVAPARDFWMARQRYEYKYKLSGIISVVTALIASIVSIIVVIFFNKNNYNNVAEGRLFANYFVIYFVAAIMWIYLMIKGKVFFNKTYWKFSLSLSIPLIGYSISKQVLDVSDRQMISKLIGNSEVGIYSILYTISSLSLLAWSAINSSFVPYLFKNINNPDKHSNLRNVSTVLLGLYGLIAIIMTYFAPEIVRILATDEYYEAIYIMPPIAAGVFLTSVANMYSNILIYYKKTSTIMISAIIAAITNLILNYIFIKSIGYQAAAYTTLVSYIILTIIQSYIANKTYKKISNYSSNIYDNKIIFIMSSSIIIISLFGLLLYHFIFLRYIACIIIIGLIFILCKKNKSIIFNKE